MAYEWDIFISYKRDELPKLWMEETFLKLFKGYLKEALGGREIKIYRDVEGIEGGANWPNSIKRALATSRCLVPILLPSYFQSEWCTKEMAVIYHRQERLGYSTVNNPGGLIVPLKIHDGDDFPPFVNNLQILDCNDYFIVGEAFTLTPGYVDFQRMLMKWVGDVAKAVKRAPEWNPEWLEEKWLEVPHNQFMTDQINAPAPKL